MYTESQILHHIPNTQTSHGVITLLLPIGQQILQTPIGVNLHSTEVVESIDKPGLLAKLLSKGITQVVRGIGRDEQNGLAGFGELDRERARSCRLSDATFTTDEYPAEGFLVEERLESGLHVEVVGLHDSGGHCDRLVGFVFQNSNDSGRNGSRLCLLYVSSGLPRSCFGVGNSSPQATFSFDLR